MKMQRASRRKVLEELGQARMAVFKGVQLTVTLEIRSKPFPLEEGPHAHSVLCTGMGGPLGHCALPFTSLWVSQTVYHRHALLSPWGKKN